MEKPRPAFLILAPKKIFPITSTGAAGAGADF